MLHQMSMSDVEPTKTMPDSGQGFNHDDNDVVVSWAISSILIKPVTHQPKYKIV